VLPVLNRPLLHFTLESLAAHGVREVLVNTHHLPESVRRGVGSGRRFGLRVRYSHEPQVLGSGGGPRKVRDFFGKGPALLVNGDCLFDFDLGRLLRRHLRSGARATLALKPNPDPRRYPPVVCDRRGRVLSIRGLPRPRRGIPSLFTGVHVLDPALLDRLPEGPSDIVSALYAPLLAEGGRIEGLRLRGRWLDLGTPRHYLRAQMALLRSRRRGRGDPSLRARGARVGGAARVVRSVLGTGCRVGRGAEIRGSVLWPGARVGEGAKVSDSIVTSKGRVAPGERIAGAIVLDGRRAPIG
jgi:NDP-sugar pyrophosphorylase family protein